MVQTRCSTGAVCIEREPSELVCVDITTISYIDLGSLAARNLFASSSLALALVLDSHCHAHMTTALFRPKTHRSYANRTV